MTDGADSGHTSHSDPNIKGDIEINMLLIVQRVSQLQILAANEIKRRK